MGIITPEWPAPGHVHAFFTTRQDGVSEGVYASLNLGLHVQDNRDHVLKNRALLQERYGVPAEPLWLEQVHSADVLIANAPFKIPPHADGSVTKKINLPLAVMTADCLPVLLTNRQGSVVAVAHAGWRGLCAGVLENTVRSMDCDPADILAWMGPAISVQAFEVGNEVREAFMDQDPQAIAAFTNPHDHKWFADIYILARQRLQRAGVTHVFGQSHCTFDNPESFFSYRRDGQTGRMAGVIWLAAN